MLTLAVPDDPRDVLAARLGADAAGAEDVRWLVRPDPRKNFVVHFRRGADRLVLKVFRDSPDQLWKCVGTPVLRHVVGAYCLHAPARTRARVEREATEAFRAAGCGTLDVVGVPSPDALVFRFVEAAQLNGVLEREKDPSRVVAWVRRLAEDLARRQRAALERADRRLLHPHPRLSHVLVAADGTLVHHDFEGVVNPSLPLPTALGLELECFLSFLAVHPRTRAPECLRAACDGAGEEAVARWRALRRPALWFLSGSARNRRKRLGWMGHRDDASAAG